MLTQGNNVLQSTFAERPLQIARVQYYNMLEHENMTNIKTFTQNKGISIFSLNILPFQPLPFLSTLPSKHGAPV